MVHIDFVVVGIVVGDEVLDYIDLMDFDIEVVVAAAAEVVAPMVVVDIVAVVADRVAVVEPRLAVVEGVADIAIPTELVVDIVFEQMVQPELDIEVVGGIVVVDVVGGIVDIVVVGDVDSFHGMVHDIVATYRLHAGLHFTTFTFLYVKVQFY